MNKKFYQSKKWIAFIVSLLVIAGVLIVALATQTFTIVMGTFMSIGIIGICILAIAYINGQVAVDKFIDAIKRE